MRFILLLAAKAGELLCFWSARNNRLKLAGRRPYAGGNCYSGEGTVIRERIL